jgi:hypothetical protein
MLLHHSRKPTQLTLPFRRKFMAEMKITPRIAMSLAYAVRPILEKDAELRQKLLEQLRQMAAADPNDENIVAAIRIVEAL